MTSRLGMVEASYTPQYGCYDIYQATLTSVYNLTYCRLLNTRAHSVGTEDSWQGEGKRPSTYVADEWDFKHECVHIKYLNMAYFYTLGINSDLHSLL